MQEIVIALPQQSAMLFFSSLNRFPACCCEPLLFGQPEMGSCSTHTHTDQDLENPLGAKTKASRGKNLAAAPVSPQHLLSVMTSVTSTGFL